MNLNTKKRRNDEDKTEGVAKVAELVKAARR